MVHIPFLCVLLSLQACIAAFTKPARWSGTNLVIQKNSAGTWCFLPVAGETTAVDCKGDHADLQGALTAHLQQDLSIAYYNAIDNTQKGGATWSITNATELIHLCASGKGGDGVVQTICSTVNADDAFTGTPYCEVALGPHVSDGCYSDTPTTSPVRPTSSSSSSSSPSSSNTPSTSAAKSSPSTTTSTTTSSESPHTNDPKASSTSTSSPTAINININDNGPKKTNWLTEVFVPIFVGSLGIIAAIIGIRKYC